MECLLFSDLRTFLLSLDIEIEDNKTYLNNIMEKVVPKSKTKLLQNLDIDIDIYIDRYRYIHLPFHYKNYYAIPLIIFRLKNVIWQLCSNDMRFSLRKIGDFYAKNIGEIFNFCDSCPTKCSFQEK